MHTYGFLSKVLWCLILGRQVIISTNDGYFIDAYLRHTASMSEHKFTSNLSIYAR